MQIFPERLSTQPPMSPEGERYSAACLAGYAAAIANTHARLDVPYGDDPAQRLDVFMPRQKFSRPLPILMFIHGGGWTNGTKEWCGFMATNVADLPAILVCPSYRLIPTVGYPTPVMDCIRALRWIQDHCAELGGSPDKVLIGGHSAGGQIAALIAVQPKWRADFGVTAIALRGCFCVSTTFNRRMVNPRAGAVHVPLGPQDMIQPDSPLALADAVDIPFLVTWGGLEDERLPRTGQQFLNRLREAQCPAEGRVFEGREHFDMHLDLGVREGAQTLAFSEWSRRILV